MLGHEAVVIDCPDATWLLKEEAEQATVEWSSYCSDRCDNKIELCLRWS